MFEFGFIAGLLIGLIVGLALALWIGYWKVKQKLANLTLSAQGFAIDTATVAGKQLFQAARTRIGKGTQ
jgi:Na+/proline symporter